MVRAIAGTATLRRTDKRKITAALHQPIEKISVEMVFRSLYYVARAFLRGDATNTVTYLAERYPLFGLVKA